MAACVDAQLLLAKPVVASLLQLPDGWTVSSIQIRDDGLVEVDVVFPDGPTELPPVRLIPYYKRVWHNDGRAVALDRLELVAQLPDRPVVHQ